MKNSVFMLAVAALLAGCVSKSPYDHLDNWLIREDPVRPFFVHADIIYVPGDLYVDMGNVSHMSSYAKEAVGKGKFSGIARVFSPLVAEQEDVEKALEWYLDNHQGGNRPFVFIGEGEGGTMLKAYEAANAEWLAERGLVASFYSDLQNKDFVTEDMVREIRNAIARARYRAQWGRDMPSGMLGR
jgi:hypothetical protein